MRREQLEVRRALFNAWHVAAFAGAAFSKRGLPRLESLLREPPKKPSAQSQAVQVAMWRALTESIKAQG